MQRRRSQHRALCAAVPVKLLARTKERLAPVLSPAERETLACAMLEDVLAALVASPALARVIVVTDDERAALIARSAGAALVRDGQNSGINGAALQAMRYVEAQGYEGLLIMPADVPRITTADVDALVEAHEAVPSVTLVRAESDRGTNALIASPAGVIPFSFGEGSFDVHCAAALGRGITPRVTHVPHLARDIDRPDDLAAFAATFSSTKTYALLKTSGIADRIAAAQVA